MLHFEWVCCFRWFLFILYSFFIRCLSIPLFVYRLVLYLSEIEYVRVTIFMSCFLFPVSPRFFLGMYYVVCVCVQFPLDWAYRASFNISYLQQSFWNIHRGREKIEQSQKTCSFLFISIITLVWKSFILYFDSVRPRVQVFEWCDEVARIALLNKYRIFH